MKTTNSRKPRRRVTPRLGDKYYYHYKLRKIENLDSFIGMIRSYIYEFEVRPLLVDACMGFVKESALFNQGRKCFICLSNETRVKDSSPTLSDFKREIAISLFHELIHVEIYHVFGIRNRWDHDEKLIEETSEIWADRFPEIITIFEDIFGCDLSPNEEGVLEMGKYFQAFIPRPVRFQLELFNYSRLAPIRHED